MGFVGGVRVRAVSLLLTLLLWSQVQHAAQARVEWIIRLTELADPQYGFQLVGLGSPVVTLWGDENKGAGTPKAKHGGAVSGSLVYFRPRIKLGVL